MRSLSIAALLLLVLSGCSSSRTLTPGTVGSAEANRSFAGKTATVTLADGQTVPALSVVVLADSTTWVAPDTREFVRVATSDVVSITRRSRGRGMVQGALISGLVTATAVGTAVMLDTGDWGGYSGVKPAFAVGFGLMSALPGAVPGGAVGFAKGAERRYDLSHMGTSGDAAAGAATPQTETSVVVRREP